MSDDSSEFDTALELCSNKHRRIVLAILLKEKRALTLNDLTKEIVKHNHHTLITDIPSEEVNRTYLLLYHQHIPKLSEMGIVTQEKEHQLVKPTEQLAQLQPYLSIIIGADPELDFFDTN